MKKTWIVTTFLALIFALTVNAAAPIYLIETTVTIDGKTEKLSVRAQAGKMASISAMDDEKKSGIKLDVLAEPDATIDKDFVKVSYTLKQIVKGQEKLIGTPKFLVKVGGELAQIQVAKSKTGPDYTVGVLVKE